MQREKKDKHFLKKAYYPGGTKAMRDFIRENLQYPREAREKGVEGTVRLRYAINYKGRVDDVEVLHSLGAGCDEEAIRLVRMMKFKVPKTRGVKVLFHKKINIHFKLPKKKNVSIRYQYSVDKGSKKNDPSSSGYSYTIDL